VAITAFTLLHHRNVSAADWDHYGGAAECLKNQGFYARRSVFIHGTWFGLARQMELTKLAGSALTCPMASEWHVDVKKASARAISGARAAQHL
jgi:hypothetical protein